MVLELEPASFAFSGESPMDFTGAGEGSFSAGPQETFWVWKNSYARVLAKLHDPNTYDSYIGKNNALYLSELWYIACLGGDLFLRHMKRTAILLLWPIEPTEVNKVNSEINFFF